MTARTESRRAWFPTRWGPAPRDPEACERWIAEHVRSEAAWRAEVADARARHRRWADMTPLDVPDVESRPLDEVHPDDAQVSASTTERN